MTEWFSYYKCDDCYWKTHQAAAACKTKTVCDKFTPLDLVPVCAGCQEQKRCKCADDDKACEDYKGNPKIHSLRRQSSCYVNNLKTDILVRTDKDQPVSFIIKTGKKGLLIQSKDGEFEVSPVMFDNRQIVRHNVESGNYYPKVQGDVKTITIGEKALSTIKVIPRLEEIATLEAVQSTEVQVDLLPLLKEVERRKRRDNRSIEKIILDVVHDFGERNKLKPDETMFLVKAVGQEVVKVEEND